MILGYMHFRYKCFGSLRGGVTSTASITQEHAAVWVKTVNCCTRAAIDANLCTS